MTTTFVITLLLGSKQHRICREPSHSHLEIREQHLSRLLDGNNTAIISMVHINKSMSYIKAKSNMKDTLHITIKEQQLMFLHTIGYNQHNQVIRHNFLKSTETVSRYLNHVLYVIYKLCDEYVHPPSIQTQHI